MTTIRDDASFKQSSSGEPARRSFLMRLAALVAGGIVAIFPFAAGWGVLFDPLRRARRQRSGEDPETAGFTRICPLDALAAGGPPQMFAVSTDVVDAWTRATGQRVGSVFLSRTDVDSKPQVAALSATCPHLGCAVEFDVTKSQFACPCHESAFGKEGKQLFGPSRRGLDPLEVKLIDNDGTQEVWVAYQRFRAGVAERISVG
jgi:nitrite reductase/ring-hydroxylating ferredoxin subunit